MNIRPVIYPIDSNPSYSPTPSPKTNTTQCLDGSVVPTGQPCPSDFARSNLLPAAVSSMNAAWSSYSSGCPTDNFANGQFNGPEIDVKMSGYASLPVSQINAIINRYTPLIVSGVQGFAAAASLAANAAAFIAQYYKPASGLAQQAAAQAKTAASLAPIVANQGTGNTTSSEWGNTPWCWANGQTLSANGSNESFCPNLAWLQNGWAVYQAAETALSLAETAMTEWLAYIAAHPTYPNYPIRTGVGYHADDVNDELQDFGLANEWGLGAPTYQPAPLPPLPPTTPPAGYVFVQAGALETTFANGTVICPNGAVLDDSGICQPPAYVVYIMLGKRFIQSVGRPTPPGVKIIGYYYPPPPPVLQASNVTPRPVGLAAPTTTTTTTPTSPLIDTLVGSALGVVAGGLVGAHFKHVAIGAVAGGMVGAAGGYWYSTPATTTTTT